MKRRVNRRSGVGADDLRGALRMVIALALTIGMNAGCGNSSAPTNLPANPRLSPNAPSDQPVEATGRVEEYQAAIAPYVEKGRKTYPEARDRYLAGLAAGQHFFAVTNLRDGTDRFEQVFVAVASIKDGRITGRIASDIIGVKGFKRGDPYSFPESELLDWLITNPDGTEEGNVVGKFFDEWQRRILQNKFV